LKLEFNTDTDLDGQFEEHIAAKIADRMAVSINADNRNPKMISVDFGSAELQITCLRA